MLRKDLVSRAKTAKALLDINANECKLIKKECIIIKKEWNLIRTKLDKIQNSIQIKQSEIDAAKEKHQQEKSNYQNQLNLLMKDQCNEISGVQISLQTVKKQHQTNIKENMQELVDNQRKIEISLQKQEHYFSQEISLLDQREAKEIMELKHKFQVQATRYYLFYKSILKETKEKMHLENKYKILDMEESVKKEIARINKFYMHAMDDYKKYNNDIASANLSLVNNLKQQLKEQTENKNKVEDNLKMLFQEKELQKENIRHALVEIQKLTRKVEEYKSIKKYIKDVEKLLLTKQNQLQVKKDQNRKIKERYKMLLNEKHDLYKKLEDVIVKVQQKTEAKNLSLRNFMNMMQTQTNEIKPATMEQNELAIKKLEPS